MTSSATPPYSTLILILTAVCAARSNVSTVVAFSSPLACSSSSRADAAAVACSASPSSSSPSRFASQRSLRRAAPSSSSTSKPIEEKYTSGLFPGDDGSSALPASARRRECVKSSLTLPLLASSSFWGGVVPSASRASEPPSSDARSFLEGVATLKSGTEFKPSSEEDTAADTPPSAALYVTAKPESMSNAPKTLFDAVAGRYGGKSPPILAARFPIGDDAAGSFPFAFRLTAGDLTEEGVYGSGANENEQQYWWEGEDLIISARLDSDGVAATRDPGDLVGRSLAKAGSEDVVAIELQGRGMFGKSVTRKK